MNRFTRLTVFLCGALLLCGDLVARGRWCEHCQAEKDETCDEGMCLVVDHETDVDLEALHHVPDVMFGGGE